MFFKKKQESFFFKHAQNHVLSNTIGKKAELEEELDKKGNRMASITIPVLPVNRLGSDRSERVWQLAQDPEPWTGPQVRFWLLPEL